MSSPTALPVAIAERSLVACHDCGRLHRRRAHVGAAKAVCGRCGAVLYRIKPNTLDRALTLNLAALVFFVLANIYPFMSFKLEGREQVDTIIAGIIEFYRQDLWLLAALVFLLIFLVPLFKHLGTIYVLGALRLGLPHPGAVTVFRDVKIMHPWAMMEVYLLGVLVAIVKLSDMATITFGPALYAFCALIVLMAAAEAALDPEEIWQRLDRERRPAKASPPASARLIGCHTCRLVSRVTNPDHAVCPRCRAHLHARKHDAIARSWALVIAGFILYIPANVYPVMTVISFGRGEPDTILSGVVHLIEADMWPLAALVFFASVTVPGLKLVGMAFLLLSVRFRSRWRPRDRTLLYRIVEAVGRWSMIDIFMISILVALVKLGSIATIELGVGATSFAAVVVLTMIAAMTFDPRLIWDAMEDDNAAKG